MQSAGSKRREPLSDEVREAVDDLLHGVSTNTTTEWLLREHTRLMRREAACRSNYGRSGQAPSSIGNRRSDCGSASTGTVDGAAHDERDPHKDRTD